MRNNKIKRAIHYCWFGNGKKSKLEKRCIESWKKFAPDYEIIEWNESNFDVEHSCPFVKETYMAKKYGFLADYIRLWALYNYGGVYLDTDVELIKNIDSLVDDNMCFFGFEDNQYIMSAVVGSTKKHPVIKFLLDFYESFHFELDKMNFITAPKIWTPMLCSYGIKANGVTQKINLFTLYSSDYFCPKQPYVTKEGFVRWKTTITSNTYCIHHFLGSWLPKKKFTKKIKSLIYLIKCKLGIINV